MNPKKFTIKINTIGISLDELPAILEQITESFEKGYINGAAHNDIDLKDYSFSTTEV